MTDTDRIAQMESMIRADMEKVCDEALDRAFKPISGCGIEAKIAQMAREAGASFDPTFESVGDNPMWVMSPEDLARFARLVAEDCAKVCEGMESHAEELGDGEMHSFEPTADECADAIRARYRKE